MKELTYLLEQAKKGEIKITYCGQSKTNEDLWQITRDETTYLALQGTKRQIIGSLKEVIK